MTNLTLTPTRLLEGVWEGVLTLQEPDAAYQPEIEVSHLNQPLEGVEISEDRDNNHWRLQVPVPVTALSDGVHSFLISDKRSGEKLGSFTILAGEPLSDDIRAEVELLRAELDMLKRAFRRHCVETGSA
ncbi:MAG: hypothetical protein CSA68_04215 [Rhodobacterales bacterium]|nr:MAG: hypothetical protein CSA68_04215 [Rhodobacterales bacterium]